MPRCLSRIVGQKPLWQCFEARCRLTRRYSLLLCQTSYCKGCLHLPLGLLLKCQHHEPRCGHVESSTYPVLVHLHETRWRYGSHRGLSLKERCSVWNRALRLQQAPSELGSLERLPSGVCKSFPWNQLWAWSWGSTLIDEVRRDLSDTEQRTRTQVGLACASSLLQMDSVTGSRCCSLPRNRKLMNTLSAGRRWGD